jgi:hypothetical protein
MVSRGLGSYYKLNIPKKSNRIDVSNALDCDSRLDYVVLTP